MARFDIQDVENWVKLAQDAGYQTKALSIKLNVSCRQLNRYTQEAFGQSPQAWLDQQRLLKAVQMIEKSRSAKEVAAELGFKQVSHFSRKFKIFYGLPPIAYLTWSDRQKAAQKRIDARKLQQKDLFSNRNDTDVLYR